MFNSNLESVDFYAWLSQDTTSQHWKLMFCSDENKEQQTIPVGYIVYSVLNRVNKIKDDGQIDFSEYPDIFDIDKDVDFPLYKKDEWLKYYNDLIRLIKHSSELSFNEKEKIHKIYGQFAYFLFNNFDFGEWIDFAETCDTSAEITNPYYAIYDVIKWCGNSIDESGVTYNSYWVKGFEYLFILDLRELLYNPHYNEIKIKKCEYCGDFFFTFVNQRKYCFDCSDLDKKNKIRYYERKNDKAKHRCKQICDMLSKRNDNGVAYRLFLDENQYHKNRIKGKSDEVDPDYPDIKTEKEYLRWLNEYHEKIKIRKGKADGETIETS